MAASMLKLTGSAIESNSFLSVLSRILNNFSTKKYGTVSTLEELVVPMSENDNVNPELINRNPRNLELMSLGRKPKGFKLDYPTRQYYHKVFLDQTSRHVSAKVRHFTGKTVVVASTQEWAIQKHLYSTNDVAAVRNVGRVLAQRCLESGIIHVLVDFTQEEERANRVKLFRKALEDGGLSLTEPNRIYPLRPWD